MRAAVLRSARRVVVADVPPPDPGAGEIRVRLEGSGICASELPLWQGREWFEYPRAPGEPGHEGWGRVEALGPGVGGLAVGQRVAVISQRAHAELDVCAAAHAVALPDALGAPFPGEPLACAVNVLRRAPAAAELAVVSRREEALALARSLGASSAWRSADRGLERQPPFDVVYEVTGHQEPLDLAARLTAVRGRLVLAGYHQDGRRSVDMQLWNWRGLDVINAHERDPAVYAQGLREAVAACAEGRLTLTPLITHRYALAELGEAYRVSVERPRGFVKAVWCDG